MPPVSGWQRWKPRMHTEVDRDGGLALVSGFETFDSFAAAAAAVAVPVGSAVSTRFPMLALAFT